MKNHWARLAIPVLALTFSNGAFADDTDEASAHQAMERHDAQIELTVTVMDRLNADESLGNSDIQAVISDEGEVHLKGRVENDDQRQRAEEIVSAIAGVSEVLNELQVPHNH